tara:strand:+ start:313 stop:582 length:270 start_codon:yes stop_codon:yes gene_type:complete
MFCLLLKYSIRFYFRPTKLHGRPGFGKPPAGNALARSGGDRYKACWPATHDARTTASAAWNPSVPRYRKSGIAEDLAWLPPVNTYGVIA